MSRQVGRVLEVDTLDRLTELLDHGADSMGGWRIQGLDLSGHGTQLLRLDATGAVFLGCLLDPEIEDQLRRRGALVFPRVPEVPFDPYRTRLYTADDLYDGLAGGYHTTLDARVYAWSRQRSTRSDIASTLAQALHDHAVDDALHELLDGRRVVGVMGGHDLARGTEGYADAVRLGRALAREELLVATGGGPGAMEAANLGARMVAVDDDAFEQTLRTVLARLAGAPSFRPSVDAWAAAGFAVLDDLPGDPLPTIGIPTWFYGHEPPNPFATQIAKYFRNALREDTLLGACTAGIVFLPGAAGTVQELFQDACENYYAPPAARAPMVLVGRRHWTEELPAWQLLTAMARERDFASVPRIVDTWSEVSGILGR